MKLAIQGCSHGELDSIYASLLRTERETGISIDALLLCGDFQALRNPSDFHALAVPPKYRQLGDFHAYYSGLKVAPVLTLVIGGNHESSAYMHELYHGGWLAPNIYYVGAAGVVELGGLVVSGISGIYKEKDYTKGRFEKMPYDAGSVRSVYHTRVFDVTRLKAMKKEVEVMLSHDWPNAIEQWGDTQALIKKKPFFKDEVESRTLGSPPLMELLNELKPKFWFSAHLHVKFAALYTHGKAPLTTAQTDSLPAKKQEANPEALDIDLDFDDEPGPVKDTSTTAGTSAKPEDLSAEVNVAHVEEERTTRFLALHKCLPHTHFLQILDIPSPHDADLHSHKVATNFTQRIHPSLRYHKRWLAITRAFHPHFSTQYRQPDLPDPASSSLQIRVEQEELWLDERFASLRANPASTRNDGKRKQDELEGSALPSGEKEGQAGDEGEEAMLDIWRVQQFVRTAPGVNEPGGMDPRPGAWYTNPQTEAFCNFIGIENKINPRPEHFPRPLMAQQLPPQPQSQASASFMPPPPSTAAADGDPNALPIDMDDFDDGPSGSHNLTTFSDDDELHARWKEGTG